jgi:hypothetical protein
MEFKLQLTEKRRQWFEHVKRWESSGLSQRAYCREHGLHIGSFSEYKRQYSQYQLLAKQDESNFKAVEISKPYVEQSHSFDITISLPNGIKLSIGDDTSSELAIKLTRVLMTC